jgi:peptidoglycan-associated lipoprotein
MQRIFQSFVLTSIIAGILSLSACNKKVAKVVPPSPPPPAAPTATLAANPNVINLGQSAELTWKTSNADTISIEGVGVVPSSGSRSVTPTGSTTYTLVAKGPGGTEQATARVTVSPEVAKKSSTPTASEEELFGTNVKDVFFDYDRSNVRSDQGLTAQADASFLVQHPDIKILIEGHCDDRGSEEYNLALGDNRATTLKNSLVVAGVSADRIKTTSYGKERPFCSQDEEQCWQQNRRDHLSLQQ